MPASPTKAAHPSLTLIYGQEFLVQQSAQELVKASATSGGDFGLEVIEGHVTNSAEAVAALDQVKEAVHTAPFFGGEKTVWLKSANFLGTDRTSASEAVTTALADFTDLIKQGFPQGVTLFISAADVDARRSFFKTCEKLGKVISHKLPKEESKEEQAMVGKFVEAKLRSAGKSLECNARVRLLDTVSSDLRQLDNELDKLITYVGARPKITTEDIAAIVSSSRGVLVWDLTDAFADRDLPKAITALENLLRHGENPLSLLFVVVSKTRTLLLLRDLLDRRLIQMPRDSRDPAILDMAKDAALRGNLPEDRAYNPLLSHPYALYKNLAQAAQYTVPELIAAQTLWLATNEKLVSTSLDPSLVLIKAIAQIIKPTPKKRVEL